MAKPSDTPDPQPTEEEKGTEQGAVADPEPVAAEDAAGAQETPTDRQRQREEAIADEPVAESEQRAPEATEPARAESAGIGPTEDPDVEEEADEEPAAPRVKPEIPGMDLEPDIVLERESVMGEHEDRYAEEGEEEPAPEGEAAEDEDDDRAPQPITAAAISLAADARYAATGRRKTAVARVILRPGTGEYAINGRTLEQHLPRPTLQRQVRHALETVGLEQKMDVVASIQGGGITAHAGALRHGISRALVDADPNLRTELKRRGFLTRDARVKERKKAGLKKARKRPQFSKR
jgi:small subunit ribosomal protein S9